MISRLKERLSFLGIVPVESDEGVMEELLIKASKKIMAEVGLCSLPEGLEGETIDMAAGEYLFLKKAAGSLNEFDIDGAVKQIQEGDTSITYAFGDGLKTDEERLDELIDHLKKMSPVIAAAWRKMRW